MQAVVETPGGACPSFRLAGGGDLQPDAARRRGWQLRPDVQRAFARGASVVGLATVNLRIPSALWCWAIPGAGSKDRTIQNCNNPEGLAFSQRGGGCGAS